MTYKLIATITHQSFDGPVIKVLTYCGDTFEDILSQIPTLPQHLHNLRKHKRAAFKDDRGVKHSWKLEEITEMH